MVLKKLSYYQFKILDEKTIEFNNHINVIVGNNGYGKTSLLEAIYCLMTANSFYKTQDKYLLKKGSDEYFLKGLFYSTIGSNTVDLYYNHQKNIKTYLFNNKKVPQYKTLLQHFPTVSSNAFDIEIIRESPKARRVLFDKMISYINPIYYDKLKEYNKIIKEKNILLKKYYEPELFKVWNEQLVSIGSYLIKERVYYIDVFNDYINSYTNDIPELTNIRIQYLGCQNKNELAEKIKQVLKQEITRKVSLIGPHRDDFIFYDYQKKEKIKTNLSLGETKLVIFYIKYIQTVIMNNKLNTKPIIILDDIISELDSINTEKIFKLLSKLPNQIFLSLIEKKFYDLNNMSIFYFYDKGKL